MTKDQFRKMIGENIRSARLERNLSIDELSELLDLTSGFVGLIERGRRGATAFNIYRLSEIFGMDIDVLYSISGGSKVNLSEEQANSKHRRLMSLSYDLSDKELEFLISTVKWVRQLRNSDFESDSDSDD